ncbi:MAG: hypothetical protein ACFFAE_20495 [Candidatus Hodarchaeota archaeon]
MTVVFSVIQVMGFVANSILVGILVLLHLLTAYLLVTKVGIIKALKDVTKIRNPFNDSLGVSILLGSLILWIGYFLLGLINTNYWTLLVGIFLAVLISSCFGFLASTNVGINVGLNGTAFGFLIYSLTLKGFSLWQEYSWFFFVVTMCSFFTGWFGGWLGKGQFRHSIAVSVYRVKVRDLTTNTILNPVIIIPKIENSILEVYNEEWKKGVKLSKGTIYDSIHIETKSSTNSAMKVGYQEYREDFLISKKMNRTLLTLKDALKIGKKTFPYASYTNMNYVLDSIYNFVFNVRTCAVFTNFDNKSTQTYLIVSTFTETPSIIWNSTFSQKVAEKIHNRLKNPIIDSSNSLKIDLESLTPNELCITATKKRSIPLELKTKFDLPMFSCYEERLTLEEEMSEILQLVKKYLFPETFFSRIRTMTKYFLVLFNISVGAILTIIQNLVVSLMGP